MYEKRKRLLTLGQTSACRFQGALAIVTVLCSCSIADGQVASSIRQSLVNQTSASCEPGWKLEGESCYTLTTWALPRAAAQGICGTMNSQLAEATNAREQKALDDFLKGVISMKAWIGLGYRRFINNWTWGSGRSMNYTNWDLNKPNNEGGNEYCVSAVNWKFSRWSDNDCTELLYGVCQKAAAAAAAAYSTRPALVAGANVSHTSVAALCEPGWMLKGESCYKLTTEELTWSEAQENCRSMNGLLAEVLDGRELRALNDYINLAASSTNELWIGLRDYKKDRNWTWGSGRSMNYSNWFPTEPNNIDELCVSVWPWSGSSWNDNNCSQTFLGVCQKGNCGGGWTSTRTSCYQLTNATTRAAAQAQCKSTHGSLVEINDSHEQEELHDFLKSQGALVAWIGLSMAGKKHKWKWDSGSNLTFQFWIPGEPNNERNNYCVSVRRIFKYKWNSDMCDSNYPAVCKQHKGTFNCCHQESPSSEFSTPDVHITALCEPGWRFQGESCYKLTTNPELTWNEAQDNCRSMNGLLAEVQDGRELGALNDFIHLTASSINELWIGLHDQQNDRNWTWGSGRPMNYSNWFPTEPNNSDGNERCVSVWPWSGSSWNDNNCTQTFPGVCQKGYCGGGWTSTRKSCYQLINATTRAAAQAQCKSIHGCLVEINNSHEQEELNDFLKSQDAFVAWIGLSDADKNHKWKWDSGSNLTYQYWIAGEPNNEKGEEYCVNVWQPNNYEWNDGMCDSNYPAVCKQHKGSCNGNATLPSDTALIGGGTLAAVVCSAVGALVIVVISIYLWLRKPWKKHPAERVCAVRLATTTLPNSNKCVPQREHHLNECSNSSRYTPQELGEWPPTSFPIGEEEYYEVIIDHTQNTYCHLDAQPTSLTNIYDILL